MLKRIITFFLSLTLLVLSLPTGIVAQAAGEENLLFGCDFNDETSQGQSFNGGASVSLQWVNETGIGHGDDTALMVTHTQEASYNSSLNAVVLTLPQVLPAGGTYRIVAWVYVPSANNSSKDTLTGPGIVLNDGYPNVDAGVTKFPVDFGTMPLDEWKAIDVTLPIQETPVTRLDFRFVINEKTKHPDVWYWDNIEVYQVGVLQEVTPPTEEPLTTEGYKLITTNKSGTNDDFDYELWSQRSSDPVSMILTGGGTYMCEWDAENILFRTGKKLKSIKNYSEYGKITIDYGATYNITKGDVNYLCVYGWTEDPMIEFYILEDHGSYKPGDKLIGTYEADGGTYELYTKTRVEQPSIQGTKTFEQYFGIRTNGRTEGTITVSDHFKAWDDLGLDMSGKMYEVSLCVEGYNSAGNADVYEHVLTVGDTTYGFVPEEASPTVTNDVPSETDGLTLGPILIFVTVIAVVVLLIILANKWHSSLY